MTTNFDPEAFKAELEAQFDEIEAEYLAPVDPEEEEGEEIIVSPAEAIELWRRGLATEADLSNYVQELEEGAAEAKAERDRLFRALSANGDSFRDIDEAAIVREAPSEEELAAERARIRALPEWVGTLEQQKARQYDNGPSVVKRGPPSGRAW
jgi:hypothetical protein